MSDLFEIFQELDRLMEERMEELDKIVEECDNDTKLAITRWVMKKIVEHASEGGSYRYLIYDRLGFGPEAYGPLCGDGITISNEFDLNLKDNVVEAYKSGNEKKLKEALGLCDEPGCFEYYGSGWPSENGYRMTCSKHYIQK